MTKNKLKKFLLTLFFSYFCILIFVFSTLPTLPPVSFDLINCGDNICQGFECDSCPQDCSEEECTRCHCLDDKICCKKHEICMPDYVPPTAIKKNGCYAPVCGDDYCDTKGENSENCCIDCGCGPNYCLNNSFIILSCRSNICLEEIQHCKGFCSSKEKCIPCENDIHCLSFNSCTVGKCQSGICLFEKDLNCSLPFCGNGLCEKELFESSSTCCIDCQCEKGVCNEKKNICIVNPLGDSFCEQNECALNEPACHILETEMCKGDGVCNPVIGENCRSAPMDCTCTLSLHVLSAKQFISLGSNGEIALEIANLGSTENEYLLSINTIIEKWRYKQKHSLGKGRTELLNIFLDGNVEGGNYTLDITLYSTKDPDKKVKKQVFVTVEEEKTLEETKQDFISTFNLMLPILMLFILVFIIYMSQKVIKHHLLGEIDINITPHILYEKDQILFTITLENNSSVNLKELELFFDIALPFKIKGSHSILIEHLDAGQVTKKSFTIVSSQSAHSELSGKLTFTNEKGKQYTHHLEGITISLITPFISPEKRTPFQFRDHILSMKKKKTHIEFSAAAESVLSQLSTHLSTFYIVSEQFEYAVRSYTKTMYGNVSNSNKNIGVFIGIKGAEGIPSGGVVEITAYCEDETLITSLIQELTDIIKYVPDEFTRNKIPKNIAPWLSVVKHVTRKGYTKRQIRNMLSKDYGFSNKLVNKILKTGRD